MKKETKCVKFDINPVIYYYIHQFSLEDDPDWMQVAVDRDRFSRRIRTISNILNVFILNHIQLCKRRKLNK